MQRQCGELLLCLEIIFVGVCSDCVGCLVMGGGREVDNFYSRIYYEKNLILLQMVFRTRNI